ncbi:MMPL family transporter [Marispirochaeta aestuarii]|uniref:efflux RND transporter permease subunit n=1 Tax=Marispirochaeta aestuarii TaxID=1963862 RepID=UPI0029C8E622|nr:MMPL family transporter [Marispirochaeta aestuarii]
MAILQRPGEILTLQIIRKKWWIIGVSAVLLLFSLFFSQRILIRTQLKDLLPESNQRVTSYNRISELFSTSSIILSFEGDSRAEILRAARDARDYIEQDPGISPFIEVIQLELPGDFIERWGLYMQKADDIRRSRDMFSRLNLLPFIEALNDNLEASYTGDSAEEEILTNQDEWEMVGMMSNMERALLLLRDYLENPDTGIPAKRAEELAAVLAIGDTYTFDPEGTMLLMTLVPSFSISDYDRLLGMMPEFRRVFGEITRRHPGVRIAYTGDLTREFDEQAALSFDLLVPGLIALLLILILFVFSFQQIRAVLLALISLVVGILLNVGIIGITLRELNILTTSFAVILIGLGIDFAIHVISNFTDYRGRGTDEEDAMAETFRKTGGSILIGGFTTAIAFFMLMFSDSRAISQFGFIAGCGILTCLASTLILLPALLLVFGAKQKRTNRKYIIDYRFLGSLGGFCRKRRIPVLAASIIITALLAVSAAGNRIEYNIENLTVTDSPSSITEDRIRENFNLSPQASMTTAASIEEARDLSDALKQEFLVARVSSVSDFIPSPGESQERLRELSLFRQDPPSYRKEYLYDNEKLEDLVYEIQRLEWNMIEIGDLSVANLGEENMILKKRNSMIREIFGAEVGRPGREVFQKLINTLEADQDRSMRLLESLDTHFAPAMLKLLQPMMQTVRPMEIRDIPESYSRELISSDGKQFLISIQPTEAVAGEAEFMNFDRRMAEINPAITGTVQMAIDWTREMVTESRSASVYVFAAILLLLLLTFRKLLPTLISALFLLISLVIMFGLFPILGIRLNLMSVLALPMIIGMGIDYAVHIIHRYMMEGDIGTTMTWSGKAVLLSGVTTGFGFGSLALFGSMAAVSSFGEALFIGVMVCLVLTLTFLPAVSGFPALFRPRRSKYNREVVK